MCASLVRQRIKKKKSFQSDLQGVSIIGGILARAEAEAALWDTKMGIWLAVLQSTPQTLVDGKAS